MTAARKIEPFRTMREVMEELSAAREALGEAWLVGDVSLAEGIRRKCAKLEELPSAPKSRGRKAGTPAPASDGELEADRDKWKAHAAAVVDDLDRVTAERDAVADELRSHEELVEKLRAELRDKDEEVETLKFGLEEVAHELDVDDDKDHAARAKRCVKAIENLVRERDEAKEELEEAKADAEDSRERGALIERLVDAARDAANAVTPLIGRYDHVDDPIQVYDARRATEDLLEVAHEWSGE